MTDGTDADAGPRYNSIERILESMAVNQMDWMMNSDLPEDLQEIDFLAPDRERLEGRHSSDERRILEIQQQLLQVQEQHYNQQLLQQQQQQQQQQQRQQKRHTSAVPTQAAAVNGEMPYAEIIEQCKSRGQRFRYVCEGRSAGSLAGENSTPDKKTFPTVKIQNYEGEAMIVVSLVTVEDPAKPHPHSLVGKGCNKGICTMKVSRETNMTGCFQNLGIQCVRKKDIHDALQKRKDLGVDPFSTFQKGHKFNPEDFELNVVRLCFQVFLPVVDPQNPNQEKKFTRALNPVVSKPIYDKKGATLHISRVDKHAGSVHGNEDIFILCDKIQKDDIEVVFIDIDRHWEEKGKFGQSDVHRQVAIVVKTPPYVDQSITEPVTIQMVLRRPSDNECSEPFDFKYKPAENDMQIIEGKRKRKIGQLEKYVLPSKQKSVKNEPLPPPGLSQNPAGREKKLGTKELLRRKLAVKQEAKSPASCGGGVHTVTNNASMMPPSVPMSSTPLSFSSISHTSFGNTIVAPLSQTGSSTSTTTTTNATLLTSSGASAVPYHGLDVMALGGAGLGVHAADHNLLLQQQHLADAKTLATTAAATTTAAEFNDVMSGVFEQQDIMVENFTDSVHLPFCNSIELGEQIEGNVPPFSTLDMTDLTDLAPEDFPQ